MSKIFDTHSHYNLDPIYPHWINHYKKAFNQKIYYSLIASDNLISSQKALKISQQNSHLFSAIGLHPLECLTFTNQQSKKDKDWLDLKNFFTKNKKFCGSLIRAIGETGLDYFYLKTYPLKKQQIITDNQQELFFRHISLANENNLPLIVHVRDQNFQAHQDAIELLKKYYQFKKPVILHCLSGNKEYVKKALELGCYLGLAGNITYENAQNIQNLIAYIPKTNLLLETDCPYLPPTPFRGQTNLPWMIVKTGQFLVDNFQFNLDQIFANSLKVFNLLN